MEGSPVGDREEEGVVDLREEGPRSIVALSLRVERWRREWGMSSTHFDPRTV